MRMKARTDSTEFAMLPAEEEPQSTVPQLPDPAIKAICSELPLAARCQARLVCRSWRGLAGEAVASIGFTSAQLRKQGLLPGEAAVEMLKLAATNASTLLGPAADLLSRQRPCWLAQLGSWLTPFQQRRHERGLSRVAAAFLADAGGGLGRAAATALILMEALDEYDVSWPPGFGFWARDLRRGVGPPRGLPLKTGWPLTAEDVLTYLEEEPGQALAEEPGQALAGQALAEAPGQVLPGQALAEEPGQVLAGEPGQALAEEPGQALAEEPGQARQGTPHPHPRPELLPDVRRLLAWWPWLLAAQEELQQAAWQLAVQRLLMRPAESNASATAYLSAFLYGYGFLLLRWRCAMWLGGPAGAAGLQDAGMLPAVADSRMPAAAGAAGLQDAGMLPVVADSRMPAAAGAAGLQDAGMLPAVADSRMPAGCLQVRLLVFGLRFVCDTLMFVGQLAAAGAAGQPAAVVADISMPVGALEDMLDYMFCAGPFDAPAEATEEQQAADLAAEQAALSALRSAAARQHASGCTSARQLPGASGGGWWRLGGSTRSSGRGRYGSGYSYAWLQALRGLPSLQDLHLDMPLVLPGQRSAPEPAAAGGPQLHQALRRGAGGRVPVQDLGAHQAAAGRRAQQQQLGSLQAMSAQLAQFHDAVAATMAAGAPPPPPALAATAVAAAMALVFDEDADAAAALQQQFHAALQPPQQQGPAGGGQPPPPPQPQHGAAMEAAAAAMLADLGGDGENALEMLTNMLVVLEHQMHVLTHHAPAAAAEAAMGHASAAGDADRRLVELLRGALRARGVGAASVRMHGSSAADRPGQHGGQAAAGGGATWGGGGAGRHVHVDDSDDDEDSDAEDDDSDGADRPAGSRQDLVRPRMGLGFFERSGMLGALDGLGSCAASCLAYASVSLAHGARAPAAPRPAGRWPAALLRRALGCARAGAAAGLTFAGHAGEEMEPEDAAGLEGGQAGGGAAAGVVGAVQAAAAAAGLLAGGGQAGGGHLGPGHLHANAAFVDQGIQELLNPDGEDAEVLEAGDADGGMTGIPGQVQVAAGLGSAASWAFVAGAAPLGAAGAWLWARQLKWAAAGVAALARYAYGL
ncbi:hypothetical protein COO60DRAFT_1626728 [Scenedesmus sp. NREL 46B-D3]|nr:hypothetical protein COO60DRAFT_1626728 [Scenedesmus sp. NREL 46B-D3]